MCRKYEGIRECGLTYIWAVGLGKNYGHWPWDLETFWAFHQGGGVRRFANSEFMGYPGEET